AATAYSFASSFLFRSRQPLIPTLFPYTTLFRSETVNGLIDPPRCSSVELAQFLLRPGVEQDAIAHRLSFEGLQDFLSGHRFDLRSEEHTSELQSRFDLVCRLLLEKKNKQSRGTM